MNFLKINNSGNVDVKDGFIKIIDNTINETPLGRFYQYDNTNTSWVQLGENLDGEATNDFSGWSVSLSSDGSIVAIGAPYNDGNGNDSGHIRVYKYNENSSWEQLGQDIDGEAGEDQSGFSVSLSDDGSIVAIGARYNDGNGTDSGHVRVYQFNDSNSSWEQLGEDIDGEATYDNSGWSISLSDDGSIVAIGANYNNGENGFYSGHVRVYQYNGASWVQLGLDIDGEAKYNSSGHSVSLSSGGDIVAIGAVSNNGENGNFSGHVRVYKYNENSSWVQLGQDIDGEAPSDRSGSSVSLSSDGSIVAIGAELNDNANGDNSGHVRVYKYNENGSWVQLGQDIDGEATSDFSGRSISLSSNGYVVAIGTVYNNGANGTSSGHVRIYQYDGTSWVQLGPDIDGEAAYDNSGWSISLSGDGSIVAIGAVLNNNANGNFSGHVRVYKIAE